MSSPESMPCFLNCVNGHEYALRGWNCEVRDKECECPVDEAMEATALDAHFQGARESDYAIQYRAGSGGVGV